MTPEGKSPKGNMPEKVWITSGEIAAIPKRHFISAWVSDPKANVSYIFVPEAKLLASEEKVERYRKALERIKDRDERESFDTLEEAVAFYSHAFFRCVKIAEEALKP